MQRAAPSTQNQFPAPVQQVFLALWILAASGEMMMAALPNLMPGNTCDQLQS
jgi:hypothetical protein